MNTILINPNLIISIVVALITLVAVLFMLYSLKPNHEIKSEVIEDLLQISTQTIDEDIDRLLDQYSIFYKNSNYIYGSRVYDAAVEAVKFA